MNEKFIFSSSTEIYLILPKKKSTFHWCLQMQNKLRKANMVLEINHLKVENITTEQKQHCFKSNQELVM